jgi:AsmA protein
MHTSRVILLGALGIVGLVVIAVAAALLAVDLNDHRARVESAASSALGMQVSVGGRLEAAFFPGLLVSLEDVRIRNRGADLASAKKARLSIELLPLLRKEVRVRAVALEFPRVSIEKDRQGRFNFETPDAAAASLPSPGWPPTLSLSDATFVYEDKQSADTVTASACRVDLHGVRLPGRARSLAKDLSFTAELACGEVRSDGFAVSDVKASADAQHGVLELDPVAARMFGTPGSGSIRAEFSGAVPTVQVRYSLSQFPIEEFFRSMSLKQVAAGRLDFSANLSMQGTSTVRMRQTMEGRVSLRGRNLTLIGGDLDAQLSRFESSQNFNLVDVGAFFFAGPLGLVVTKGLGFATLFRETGTTRSEIGTVVSDWKVERGVARAQDVAMSTRENRIALQGRLDFVHERYEDVTVALVDANGCATVKQKISGTFQDPVVEKPNILASLTGPAMRLLKKGRDILRGESCDVFYAGSVPAPR